MTEANETLIRSLYSALASGGPSSAAELFHSDVVWHVPGSHPLSGVYRGRQAVLDAIRDFEERSNSTVRTDLTEVAAAGEFAVAFLIATGTRRNRIYELPEFDIFRIVDGRVTEFWSFSADQGNTDAFWA